MVIILRKLLMLLVIKVVYIVLKIIKKVNCIINF